MFQQMHANNLRKHMNIQQHQRQQMTSSHQPHQFSKQTVDIKKDSEKLQNDQSRLSSLHSKLHKEAERIRHWKTEKEMELKQKDQNLSDAGQTIEKLRSSIFELQVQNESYSTKLHQTEVEKQETEQKIQTVREMANLLRDQMVQLESRLMEGEKDKKDIAEVHEKMLRENQELVLKFQDLDISQAAMREKHESETRKMKLDHESKINDLEANIRHLEDQVVSLINIKTCQEATIEDYSARLTSNADAMNELRSELKISCQKLKCSEEALKSNEEMLTGKISALDDLLKKFETCHNSLVFTEGKYENIVKEKSLNDEHAKAVEEMLTKEIQSLKEDLNENQVKLNASKVKEGEMAKDNEMKVKTISSLEEQKEAAKKGFIDQILELTNNVTDLESTLQAKTNEIEEFKNQFSITDEELLSVKAGNAQLSRTLTEVKQNLEQIALEKDSANKELFITQEKLSLTENCLDEKEKLLQKYSDEINVCMLQIESLQTKITELTNANGILENTLQTCVKESNELKVELLKVETVLIEKNKLNECQSKEMASAFSEITMLKQTVEERNNHLSELAEKENQTTENMKCELADQEKKAENLGNKTKSLQSQMNVKIKQLKNMEKEAKSLKNQLKQKNEKIEKLEDRVNECQVDVIKSKGDLEATMQRMKECENQVLLTQQQFNKEQSEFCTTLEQYKMENDKIVESYEKESKEKKQWIDELQRRLLDERNTLNQQLIDAKEKVEEQKPVIVELQRKLTEGSTNSESRTKELIASVDLLTRQLEVERTNCGKVQEEYEQRLNQQVIQADNNLKAQLARVEKELIEAKESTEKLKDDVVPTTPHIRVGASAPVTPQSIMRSSQSKRGKRVLFTGLEGNSAELELVAVDERPPKTPLLSTHSGKISGIVKPNIRFSPKISPNVIRQLEQEERMEISPVAKKNIRVTKEAKKPKYGQFKSANLDVTPAASKSVFEKSPMHRVNKSNVRRPSVFKNKMKKVTPKQEKDLSWFETDNVFGFDG